MSHKSDEHSLPAEHPVKMPAGIVALYAITIFLGAFLLFGVQPLIGRFLLPWFGGTPEVWTTCMLFFQIFLLAGYAWSHLNIRFLSSRQQVIGQILLLAVAAVTLSVIPADSLKPSGTDNPILKILIICTPGDRARPEPRRAYRQGIPP